MLNVRRLVQPAKALLPMLVTYCGSETSVIATLLLKAYDLTEVTASGTVIFFRFGHSPNAKEPIVERWTK